MEGGLKARLPKPGSVRLRIGQCTVAKLSVSLAPSHGEKFCFKQHLAQYLYKSSVRTPNRSKSNVLLGVGNICERERKEAREEERKRLKPPTRSPPVF